MNKFSEGGVCWIYILAIPQAVIISFWCASNGGGRERGGGEQKGEKEGKERPKGALQFTRTMFKCLVLV